MRTYLNNGMVIITISGESQGRMGLVRKKEASSQRGSARRQICLFRNVMTRICNFVRVLLVMLLGAVPIVVAASELDSRVGGFLETHCADCHDDVTAKGNFDLYRLDPEFRDEESLDSWVRVYDRIVAGEMPPKKKRQPSNEEKALFLGLIEPRIAAGDRERREVVHRRLNREEYQYTIEDLLHIDLDLRKYLPRTRFAEGFATTGMPWRFPPSCSKVT